jgi:methoxymalonate biosynthesis protein
VIKCLVWDLDNTLFAGVYLESPGQRPPLDPDRAAVLTELAGRGILQAVASRNPPDAAGYASELTGHDFAAVRCGWGAKSAAIAAMLDELGLTAAETAFVDDDAMERAEVSFALPELLVLAPEELPQALTWPQFSPPVLTAEGRRRGELYAQRRARREEAAAFGGSVEEFLRLSGTQVLIATAGPADLPRLHELSVRTHQFSSAGVAVPEATFAELLADADHQVVTVTLSDKFGDDGLVGGCVLGPGPDRWLVPLLMMSCRAMGRGVIGALLSWIALAAARAGAREVALACVLDQRNVPLRVALVNAGFRADADAVDGPWPAWARRAEADRIVTYRRALTEPLPGLPDWVTGVPGA